LRTRPPRAKWTTVKRLGTCRTARNETQRNIRDTSRSWQKEPLAKRSQPKGIDDSCGLVPRDDIRTPSDVEETQGGPLQLALLPMTKQMFGQAHGSRIAQQPSIYSVLSPRWMSNESEKLVIRAPTARSGGRWNVQDCADTTLMIEFSRLIFS
jgi:hypothetical protein